MVFAAGVSLAVIVLTGAAVRLTEAGLGCENWPACSDERFVPEWEFHPWIEFGNRLISGVVAAAVAIAVLTAYRRTPRRQDLINWAWGLVAGVAAQIVLGGITVRVDLHPAMVGAHFLLSMVLLWNAVVLWVRAGASGPESTPRSDEWRLGSLPPITLVNHGRAFVGLATAVLVTGTLVTGTGPNSGDSRAERLNFDLSSIARVHSVTVWCFLAVLLLLALRLRSPLGNDQATAARSLSTVMLALTVAQGGVGYLQFATGVPPTLVAVHIFGAVIIWCGAILTYLRLFDRPDDAESDQPSGALDGDRSDTEASEPKMKTTEVLGKIGS